VGDYANYYLGPNGSFESGTTGWTVSGGAKVVDGNQPFLRTGTHSSARVEVTSLGTGSNWQIDDLYVDPCIGRLG
jgi:hypothetical protein